MKLELKSPYQIQWMDSNPIGRVVTVFHPDHTKFYGNVIVNPDAHAQFFKEVQRWKRFEHDLSGVHEPDMELIEKWIEDNLGKEVEG